MPSKKIHDGWKTTDGQGPVQQGRSICGRLPRYAAYSAACTGRIDVHAYAQLYPTDITQQGRLSGRCKSSTCSASGACMLSVTHALFASALVLILSWS
jgi:hypothetical protein